MRKITFKNQRTNTTYVRVTRRVALKAFKNNTTLVVFGENENPESHWNSPSFWSYVDDSDIIDKGTISDEEWMEYHFKRLENTFEYYNNKKPWWYLPELLAEKYTK